MNEQLEFKIGEDESPATVSIGEDGAAEVLDKPQAPRVETPSQQSSEGGELDQYSEGVKKRIDKLTARLRETQRREQAALEYAKSVQARAQQLEQQYMTADSERLGEASGRVQTQAVALKQIIRKAREEGDIDTETEAQQRLTALTMEQNQIAVATQQRALNAQMDQRMRALDGDLQFMRNTFFTDEQSTNDFMEFAGYREALKRGDFNSAMGMLQQQVEQLQLLAGRKLEVDPLATFPDLRQQVDDMSMDEAHALELARHRAIQAQQQQYAQQQAQQQARAEQGEQQAQRAMSDAVQQINQMEAQWMAQDLNYPAKKQKLMELIPQIQQSFPPQLWPQQIGLLYQTLSGVTAAPQPSAPRTLRNAPLRPTGGGGGRPDPATALEAMNQALNYND